MLLTKISIPGIMVRRYTAVSGNSDNLSRGKNGQRAAAIAELKAAI